MTMDVALIVIVDHHDHHPACPTQQETMVRGGETMVRLMVQGERFDTVMAAIGSHVSRPVKLEVCWCTW